MGSACCKAPKEHLLTNEGGNKAREFKLTDIVLERQHPLGAGMYATVYKGTITGTQPPIMVAVKEFKRGVPRAKESYNNEAVFMTNAKHDKLLSLNGVKSKGPNYWIVMALLPDGSLDGYESKRTISGHPLSAEECLEIVTQIADAMAYLFDHKLTHGDLATRNVLVDASTKGIIRAVLSDYGTIQKHDTDEALTHESKRKDVMDFGDLIGAICGPVNKENRDTGEVTRSDAMQKSLQEMKDRCRVDSVENRPSFSELFAQLKHMCMENGRDYIGSSKLDKSFYRHVAKPSLSVLVGGDASSKTSIMQSIDVGVLMQKSHNVETRKIRNVLLSAVTIEGVGDLMSPWADTLIKSAPSGLIFVFDGTPTSMAAEIERASLLETLTKMIPITSPILVIVLIDQRSTVPLNSDMIKRQLHIGSSIRQICIKACYKEMIDLEDLFGWLLEKMT